MDETSGPEVKVYDDGEPASFVLGDAEVRVLGSLVEKQVSTPDYYPLTLNALRNACNQSTSREPVVEYDESTVIRALDRLRDHKLAFAFAGAESRTLKYGHKFAERLELNASAVAVLCVLMLRGPQTAGEIRTRSGRLHEFASVNEVEETLNALISRQPAPLVAKLPRQPGTKESRFAHLLSGAPTLPDVIPAALTASESDDRVASLEREVAGLRQELSDLRAQFAEFRKQFE
jgi:uncharacterized protein YceH (UPF0502 family)